MFISSFIGCEQLSVRLGAPKQTFDWFGVMLMVGDFRGCLLSLKDPFYPLSPFTQLPGNLPPFNLPCSTWKPCQFLHLIFAKLCFWSLLFPNDRGAHICCSLCFYLELGIWKESVCTRGQAFVCMLVWACRCERAPACACACTNSHGCALTHVHRHVSFWMTECLST